jgi:hypothetical protein
MVSLTAGLSACTPKSVPIVSSTSNSKPYVHASAAREKSYVSAMESARTDYRAYGDYALANPKSTPKNVDPEMEEAFLAAMMQEEPTSPVDKSLDKVSGVVGKANDSELSFDKLWGKPPTFLGSGVTIMNKQIRKRFNDAIATTPVQGKVEWRYGKSQFIFMPNSEIYQPFYSGGNCRDGVFIHFDGKTNERTRSLFCQQGIGSDWFIQK